MKYATNKYHVVKEGTMQVADYYGYTSRKQAEIEAEKWTIATGQKHIVVMSK